jgi:hypothetical protein
MQPRYHEAKYTTIIRLFSPVDIFSDICLIELLTGLKKLTACGTDI